MAGEQVQTPTVQDAHATLYERVHVPYFFHKLAQDHGIRPRDEHEAQQLLEMGAYLQAEQRREKAASPGSLIAAAHDGLFRALGERGVPGPQALQHEQAVKAAAAGLAADPAVRDAAAVYRRFLAERR